jgi:hypothetical protein
MVLRLGNDEVVVIKLDKRPAYQNVDWKGLDSIRISLEGSSGVYDM